VNGRRVVIVTRGGEDGLVHTIVKVMVYFTAIT
jgi:hypothetical protein